PSAGWPGGTSGISRRNSGPSSRASRSTSPAFSAMRRKPSQRVRVPNNRTMTSTDSRAMANRLSTSAANTAGSPPSSQRARAATVAIRKKPSQRPLSMSLSRTIDARDDNGVDQQRPSVKRSGEPTVTVVGRDGGSYRHDTYERVAGANRFVSIAIGGGVGPPPIAVITEPGP